MGTGGRPKVVVRIIAGKYKGRQLKSVPGLDVRPTSDRLRETLFDILGQRLDGKSFLDVCAGSGAVGIEALSRGAKSVTFIEQLRKASAVIRENLQVVSAEREAKVLVGDAAPLLERLDQESGRFDVIFCDPPYASPIYRDVMNRISSSSLLAEGGVLVVEHRAKTPPNAEYGDLRLYRDVRQGDSALAFYRRI
ncbi:MAG TPA: 16S rRNA (guanine(966)-N(2))-methyltransferase RsmD [Blastocatellia bacterium]|nr:16S rRNA (guanine(966)-N(2))-methyltransferase RsmD [Blastocatellia bacterium]